MEHYKNLDLADIKYFCEIDKIEKTEQWKDVIGYTGVYLVSNLARIKSLSRIVLKNGKYPFAIKDRILKPYIDTGGYLTVGLMDAKKKINRTVHQLVAESFLNHSPCGHSLVVNHIDLNNKNSVLSNLEIITQRQNSNLKHIKSSSKYVGVHWNNEKKKWASKTKIKNKVIHLGYFDKELEASKYYENALISINNGEQIICKPVNYSSKYKGISWHKTKRKWQATFEKKYLGCFNSEIEAYNAHQEFQKGFSQYKLNNK